MGGNPSDSRRKFSSASVLVKSPALFAATVASMRSFGGNSGSGVFDDDGALVAILDSGEDDYVPRGACNVVNVLDPAMATGEGLTYVRPAIEALCRTPGLESPLCDCDGPCVEALEGDTCDDAMVLPAVSGVRAVSLVGYAPDTAGSGGGVGPDRVYTITLDADARVVVAAAGGDPVLYLRRGCVGEEIACNDDVDDADRSARLDETLPPGTYTLFVDSYDGDTADVSLEVEITRVASPDAAIAPDATTSPPDASSDPDAVSLGEDAGAGADAEAMANAPSRGCGCRAQRARGDTPLALIVIALLAWRRRTRRV
jgi:MYXO-CTERM domain-containing protein